MKKSRRHAMSLIEIMIVMFIISLVVSVLVVNMRGSLDEGKAFKSQQGSKQLYEILNLEISRKNQAPDFSDPQTALSLLQESGLVRNPKKMIKDGWNEDFIISWSQDEARVTSKAWINYLLKKKNQSQAEIEDNYPWIDFSQIPTTNT